MMNKMLIRKNDTVIVISGKDKGKTGKVLKVIPEKRKIIIEKINFIKEFIRRDQSKNVQGGIGMILCSAPEFAPEGYSSPFSNITS